LTARLLFDFDGVVTRTAKVHAAACKEMFDAYPREQAARTGERFRLNEPGSDAMQTLRRRAC